MSNTVTVLVTAVIAMAKILVITLVGVLLALRPKGDPLLTPKMLQQIGRLCNLVFLPALIGSSIGANLTRDSLQQYLPLLFGDSVVRIIGLSLVTLCGRLLTLEPRVFKAVKLAVLFPNAGSLPLLFFESLCEQPIINADYNGSSRQCFNEATSQIFVYLIGWHLWFYMWGFYKLGECDDLDKKSSTECINSSSSSSSSTTVAETPAPTLPRNCSSSSSTLNLLPIAAPLTVAAAHESSVNTPHTDVTRQHKSTNRVVSACKQLAAALQQWRTARQLSAHSKPPPARWRVQLFKVLTAPANVAVVVGVVVGVIPALQKLLFVSSQSPLRPFGSALTTVGQPLVALQTLLMAASLAQTQVKLQTEHSADAVDDVAVAARHSLRKQQVLTGAVFIGVPLIGVPAVGFALFVLLDRHSSVLGSNVLMRLQLLLQLGMPGAQAVLVSLSHLGLPNMTSVMSRLYIWQYAASVVTITALAAGAMAYLL